MRIIAGKYKGKLLNEFELATTRPTADMVRGAVFNIIGNKVASSVFLDLFSGTGAVGFEAISRGAKQVFFVDCNSESINLIKKNANFLKESNYQIKKCEYNEALISFSKLGIKFDIIYLDPPYKTDLSEKAISLIDNLNLLVDDGIIIWEHDESKISFIENMYPNIKIRKYGKKYITIIDKTILCYK